MENIKCIVCESEETVQYIQVSDRLTYNSDNFNLVKCKCNFVYLNPRPAYRDIITYYKSEKYDPHYSSNATIWSKLYKFIQCFTLRWKYTKIHAIFKSGRLLDIGGGRGEFAAFMTSRGWNVVMQDKLLKEVMGNESNVYKFVQDIKEIKETEYFDVITLWHSLEHIHNIQNLFKEIHRLLTPDGFLLIAVPNLQAPDRKLFGTKWVAFDAPRHLYHFNSDSLKRLCKKYNFQILRKYCLLQDTPYNILLSISKKSILQVLRAVLALIISFIQIITRGPDYSSSFLFICKKT